MSSLLAAVHDDFESRDPDFIRAFAPLFWLIASFWFRAEVRGLERIPPDGPVLLVGNCAWPCTPRSPHRGSGCGITSSIPTVTSISWTG